LAPAVAIEAPVSHFKAIALPALLGTPILFLLIEGALRVAGVAPQPRVLVDPRTCYTELEPGAHLHRTLNGLEHDLWLDGRGFRVSEAVARGEEIVAPAACRVLALGDSFTEGFFVTPEETWPAQVERRLRERGYDVRVDNGGFRGRSIVDERFAALTRWAPLRHDIVVLEHTMNDIEDLIEARRAGCVEPRFTLLRDWRIYRLAREAAMRLPFARRGQGAPPTEAECRAMSTEYRTQLLETARALHDDGRRFLFVQLEPFGCAGLGDRVWAQYHSVWDEYGAELRRGLADAGAGFVDVTEALRVPGRSLRPADTHPNAAGYAAAAEGIAAAIEASGFLDRCIRDHLSAVRRRARKTSNSLGFAEREFRADG
jgi:lysophospholipase L1-like esterase